MESGKYFFIKEATMPEIDIVKSIVLFCLSLFGGFMSGLLGLGGAVVMIPLMLVVPPLFGVEELSMKTVSALSMLQVLFASISGIIIHKKNSFVHVPTLLAMGIPMGCCSLLGAYLSKYMDNSIVMLFFGALVIVALIMMFIYKSDNNEDVSLESVNPNRALAITIGACIGTLSGIVGAGGGFMLIPLMVLFLRIPLKITVGTSLGIVFIGAFFGAIGKIASGQVEWLLLLPVILGSLIAAQFGARVSKMTPSKVLKGLLIAIIALSVVQTWGKIIALFTQK